MNCSWNKMTYIVVITFTIIVILVTSIILVVKPEQSSPITRNCTKTTGQGGEQIETCHVVEQSGSRLINKTETTIPGPVSINIKDPGKVDEITTLTTQGNPKCTITTGQGGEQIETCHVVEQSGSRLINKTETTIRGPVSINIKDPGKVDEITTLTTQGNPKCTITTGQRGEQIKTCHVVEQTGRALINTTEITIRARGSIDINEPGKVIQVTTLATLTTQGSSITRNCTKTTSQGGKKITKTCHVVGQRGGRHINTTETTISGSGYIDNNESGPVLHFGNTFVAEGNNYAGYV